MTNAREELPEDLVTDFDLDTELAETAGWDNEGSGPRGPDPPPPTGALDLAERHPLRRVAGLSTELEDIPEVEYRQLRLERVVLVGVWTDGTVEDAENSMAELALLAETAGSEGLEAIYQGRQSPDRPT